MKTIIYNFTILTIALLFSQIGSINAKSTIWNGSVSSSFSNSGNWSNGIPDSLDFITFNSNAPNNLILTQNQKITNLTINGDTLDLGGFTFEITGTAYFNGGRVTNGVLKPTGSLCHFGGATLDARIEATCGYFHMNSGVYKKPVFLTSTGAATSSSTYGNHFEDSLTITSNGAVYFNMGSSGEDIYDGPVILYNYSSKEIRLAATDTSYFNNHVTVNASSGGVEFGASGGVSILASAKTISVGTFSSSYLTLTKFIQLGSSAQTLTLSGTGVVSLESCIFNGNLTINAPGILTKTTTYNGNTTFNRTGSATNFHSYGSNVYAGNVTWDNAGSGGRVRLASTAPDTYLADATFSSSGGQDMQVAYVGDNTFAGNITINSNKVVFNTSTGKVSFTGANNQTLNGSYSYPFKKLAINKTAGTVTANTTLSVDDSLIFIQGNLITTSTNLLTMKHGSTTTGASNSSFVSGPVKKVGNSAFVFNVGSGNTYRPLTITAPSNTTDAFTAEYYNTGQTLGNTKDTTITFVSDCGYWKLDRNVGSSNITPKFAFDSLHCDYLTVKPVHIALWNGTKWTDKGEAFTESTNKTTSSAMNSYGYFAFAYDLKAGDAPQYPLIIQTSSTCSGMDVEFNQKEFWISFDVDSALFKIALFSPENDSVYAPIAKLEVFNNYEVGQNQTLIDGWNFDCDSLFQTSIRKTAVLDTSKQYLLKVTRYMPGECAGIYDTLDHFLNFCLMNIRSNPACTTHLYESAAELQYYLGDLSQGGQAVNGDIVAPDPLYPNLDIDLSGYPPLTIEEGINLTGNYDLLSNDINISGLNPACPLLTYQDNNTSPYGTIIRKNVKGEMISRVLQNPGYMFFMFGQSRLNNLKLVGGMTGFQDYNEDNFSSACIKLQPGIQGPATIENCNISNFCYTTIFMEEGAPGVNINNCLIHRVKGSGGHDTNPKGYGMWLAGTNSSLIPVPEVHIDNCYFDECKTAIDDKGELMTTTINNCTFGYFFNQETINRHNEDGSIIYKHPATSNGCLFYVSGSPISTTSDFDITDKVAGDYSILNSIFYQKGSVVSTPFPVQMNGQNPTLFKFTLGNSTFSETKITTQPNNTGGYAKIADNDVEACVWDDDKLPGEVFDGFLPNTHDYVPGNTTFVSGTPQPVEPTLTFSGINGTVPGFSSSSPEIAFINQGDDFIVQVSAPGTNAAHMIRAHPSNNAAVGGATHNSGNNSYNNAEIVTNPTTIQVSETFGPSATEPRRFDTNKPGLYGIDLISLEASGPYKVSQMVHKPIIVSPTSNHLLIFNIKDSYYADSYSTISLSGDVYKQVELNGHLIWREPIQLGGDDWEHVQIDLYGGTSVSGQPIKNHLKLNEKNTITFSIGLDLSSTVSTSELRGLVVWIDDVYLKKYDSPENLIKDGDIENSEPGGLASQPTSASPWYQLNVVGYDDYSLNYTNGHPTPPSNDQRAQSQARVGPQERKSGKFAIQLDLDGMYNHPYYPLPVIGGGNPNDEVISAAIDFDAKYFLGCSEVASMNGVQEIKNMDIVPSTPPYDDGLYIIREPLEVQSGEILDFAGSSYFIDATSGPVTITVKHDGLLKIYNANGFASRLFSCEDMWDGIIVEDGGRVEIYPSSSYPTEIYDAIKAIEVEGGISTTKPLKIRYALFDHNLVGLDLSDADYYSGLLTASEGILGIDFKCTGGEILKEPHIGEPAYAHIQLTNVTDIQIGSAGSGSPQSYTNTFSDAIFGIKAINSQATIINNEFSDITTGTANCMECGSSIFFENTDNVARDLIIGGPYVLSIPYTEYLKNQFSNSKNGIFTRGNHVTTIQSNTFNNIYQGIRCNRNYENITINEENTFSETKFGVILFNVRGDILVDGNVFNDPGVGTINPSFYRTAITVQNPTSNRFFSQAVSITNNEIADYRIGIHAANVQNIIIGGYDGSSTPVPNEINYHLDDGSGLSNYHTGIWLQNCDHAVVKVNTIKNDALISSNPKFMRGLVADNSTFLNICGNTVEKMGVAMQFEGDCQFSELKNNIIMDYNSGINYINAKFTPQGNSAEPWDNTWIQTNTNTSLIKVDGNLVPFNPFFWSFRGDDIASGNNFSPNPYSSLVVFADPFATGSTIDCIAETLAVAGIDRDAVYGPVVADTITYSENQDNYRYLAREALFKLLSENPGLLTISSSLDSAFAAFYDEMRLENAGKFDSVQMAINTNELVEAGSLNEAIDGDNAIETNRKIVNNIQINKIEMDIELDASDTTALESIYEQQWKAGGLATYEATAILFREYYTEENSLRVQNMPQEETASKPETRKDLGIYPNPAKGKIYFDRILSPLTIVKLFDASGRQIMSCAATNEIDIRGLEDGFYVLKVIEDQTNVYFKNVVIIK